MSQDPIDLSKFPGSIDRIRTGLLPTLFDKFSPDRLPHGHYDRITNNLAFVTSDEHTHIQNHPYKHQDWENAFHKCWSHLNEELSLGLNPQVINALTISSTVLQETRRFMNNAAIDPLKGENTAVHELHTLPQMLWVVSAAIAEDPELAKNIHLYQDMQMTCLMLAVHDKGEVFGEAGSLSDQVLAGGDNSVKDKYTFEKLAMETVLTHAFACEIDGQFDRAEFYKRMDQIKQNIHVQNNGGALSDEDMAADLNKLLHQPVELSFTARETLRYFRNAWETVEHPETSTRPFLGYLATILEHIQGTRHINRHGKTLTTYFDDNGQPQQIEMSRLNTSLGVVAVCKYIESGLGELCDHAQSPLEDMIARQTCKRAYSTLIDYISNGPAAFFTKPGPSSAELALKAEPYNATETRQRLSEIENAKNIAGNMSAQFSDAAAAKCAITREDAIALYQTAIETQYIPAPGEILISAPPKALYSPTPPETKPTTQEAGMDNDL